MKRTKQGSPRQATSLDTDVLSLTDAQMTPLAAFLTACLIEEKGVYSALSTGARTLKVRVYDSGDPAEGFLSEHDDWEQRLGMYAKTLGIEKTYQAQLGKLDVRRAVRPAEAPPARREGKDTAVRSLDAPGASEGP